MISDPVEVLEVEVEPNDLWPVRDMSIRAGFTYGGIVAGFVLGIYEAILVRTRPRYTILATPDTSSLMFLVGPLTDILALGLVGLVLDLIAEKVCSADKSCLRWLGAVEWGLAGGVAWGASYLRFGWDSYPSLSLLGLAAIAGGAGTGALAAVARRRWEHRHPGFDTGPYNSWLRRLKKGAVTIVIFMVGALGTYELRGAGYLSGPTASGVNSTARPNIILITLDAATAGHLSCYGYVRQTTPNIDSLAQRGVQFENAIAPSSWTLPSFASMFTGLLPHQHGASGTSPLPDRFPTLAMALNSAGYQTVGFNANPSYGQASQGIGRGFDKYEDGSGNLRQNFIQTLLGRAFLRFIWNRFPRLDRLERQNAEEINQKVFHWFAHRKRQPYFLFINYFDVHSVYYAPPPFSRRFGEMSDRALRRRDSEISQSEIPAPTSEDRASLVAGYDNSLAYADSQVEALMQFLAKSPDGANTVVIITSDHGEAFGEHGHYRHGWNLSRELVHVPLIIFGPGIPAGTHVRNVVPTRKLYATILSLAQGNSKASLDPSSLQEYWSARQDSLPETPVLSELTVSTPNPQWQNAYISLTTSRWQWILDAHGHAQIFDWVHDPGEKTNLAGSPEARAVVDPLQRNLHQWLMTSGRPWTGLGYLLPLGLGSPASLNPWDRDLLDSLPYH